MESGASETGLSGDGIASAHQAEETITHTASAATDGTGGAEHQLVHGFHDDNLVSGRRFRTLYNIDDFNLECLAIEIDTSLPSERVIRILERLRALRGHLTGRARQRNVRYSDGLGAADLERPAHAAVVIGRLNRCKAIGRSGLRLVLRAVRTVIGAKIGARTHDGIRHFCHTRQATAIGLRRLA